MDKTLYLVRRYENALEKGDYGVDDRYMLVFATTNKCHAAIVKAACEKRLAITGNSGVVDILEVTLGKMYGMNEQIYLGGGCYIE